MSPVFAEFGGLQLQRTSELHAQLHVSFEPMDEKLGPGGRLAEAER